MSRIFQKYLMFYFDNIFSKILSQIKNAFYEYPLKIIGVNVEKNDFVLSCTCDQIKPIIVCLSVSCKKR